MKNLLLILSLFSFIFSSNEKLYSISPVGFLLGGISSLSIDSYTNNFEISSTRYDVWTLETSNWVGWEDENIIKELGFGLGMGKKYYLSNANRYSGLFVGLLSDFLLVKVDVDYIYEDEDWGYIDYQYYSVAFASSVGLGFSMPIGKLRFERILNASYVLIIDEYDTSSGILIIPELRIGLIK